MIARIAMLFAVLACVAAGPTTHESRLAIARKIWDDRLAQTGGKAVVSEYYPTEEALAFLSAWDLTRDEKYATQAKIQLDYAHGREKDALMLISSGVCHRDYQARHVYNFYVAYRILADGKYLKCAD